MVTIIPNEPWRWSQHVSPRLATKFCLKVKLEIVNKGVPVKSEWMSQQNLAGKIWMYILIYVHVENFCHRLV